ncbi:hypothetical protein [Burkholderia sp. MSMB1498]|nr:hypothetical protein [Burkholderia sp. MSMB1498]
MGGLVVFRAIAAAPRRRRGALLKRHFRKAAQLAALELFKINSLNEFV